MKAFVVEKYGKSGLRAAQVPDPTIGPRDVLVRVRAASINPLDKMVRNGRFKLLLKYKTPVVLGHDMAGVVTRVGADVPDYKAGDEVYARPRDLRIGTFAEYIAIDQADVALKPSSLTMEESAAVPLVALAAWQALANLARVRTATTRRRCATSAQTKSSTTRRQTSPSCSPATTSCSIPLVATTSRSR